MSPAELCRAMFDAAVARAQPSVCLPPHLPDLARHGHPHARLIVLACGKAGATMSAAVEQHYLDGGLLDQDQLVGLCVTRHGYGKDLRRIRCVEAGHPVPDAAGLKATEEVLALAASAGPDDFVLVLISGGGSAHWIAPANGLTIADKQAVTKALLASGAPIGDINTVRKHISRIKGGRLAAAIFPARSLTLAISDVPGDDLSLIASGPAVADASTAADAEAILRGWHIAPSPAVEAALRRSATESIDPQVFARAEARIVARPADSLAAAAAVGRANGYDVVELGSSLEGEARDVGAAHARMAADAARDGRRVVFLSGGELTVTVSGSGQGGPNQEYMLAFAQAIDGLGGITALAGDTDGTDGGGGKADDPAGAIADGATSGRARAMGLNAAQFLQNNDATGFFRRVGGLLHTGPTGTNVNDFRCALVDSQISAAQ